MAKRVRDGGPLFLCCFRRDKYLFLGKGFEEARASISTMVAIMRIMNPTGRDITRFSKGHGMPSKSPPDHWPLVPCYGVMGSHSYFACNGHRYVAKYGNFANSNPFLRNDQIDQRNVVDTMNLVFALFRRASNDIKAVHVGESLDGRWQSRAWGNNYGPAKRDGPILELDDGRKIWMTNGVVHWRQRDEIRTTGRASSRTTPGRR